MNIDLLKYPIGDFSAPSSYNVGSLSEWIHTISEFPEQVKNAVKGLTIKELNWEYRPGGWSIKQVIHHCGDSHMNSIIRFKLALTEKLPSIKPYHENLWAELADGIDDNISYSIQLLEGLHYRWTKLLKSLTEEQLTRQFIHPEHGKKFTLWETIANYAWHCQHHLAHIKQAIQYQGKFDLS
ncbi:MAG: metal-dependent hydrolase [Flammeovirgaceae bacterium]|nr:metal-dependent hydrolase [Flammeovirgaceae bacterium]MBE61823.1 metal-dependent hydrolase [Flammeovirgaceae bacterium]|tara:strand:+ start:5277 stop:5822 length:546 start_codon:yes stop_codon:yes gene_type:complete